MLHIDNLTYRIAGRILFDGASAVVPAGHKIGLVGRNGSGKSTLLRLILEDGDDAIRLRRSARIATVAQEAPGGAASLLESVLAGDVERTSLLAEAELASDPGRIAEIHIRLADIGSHTAPSRAGAILSGLGFDATDQAQPLDSFSGGWRMRVALAATLFAEPDILLLDEPTNYLDLEGTLWLEGYLRSYPHTMLIVSHDRTLLNSAVSGILHLEGCKLTAYEGNYNRFERTRAMRLANESSQRKKQEAQRKHMQAFVDRFRYKASKARQAQSRLKALDRLQPIAAALNDPTVSFNFPDPGELAPPIITLDDCAVGYDDHKPVLSNLTLRIDMDDRIALLGANGNGKSTLAKLLTGRLQPMAGRLFATPKLRIGYFAQHQIEELHEGNSALQHMARLMPGAPDTKARAHLGGFGLTQDKANTPVESLSGGEKARLMIAMMCRAKPHIMVLDEPTNHLDVDAREALVVALNDFPGAILLITHDPHLIEACADRLWLVENGGVAPFDGDVEDYRRRLLGERGTPGQKSRTEDAAAPKQNKKEARRAAAQARAGQADLRRTLREAETMIDKRTAEKTRIDSELADPTVYDGPTAAMVTLLKRRDEAERRLAKAEAHWLKAQSALDAVQ
ncbi:MAG: ABC-F family ATP-binding cassette domain-containing protein [Alphaproteobacteria bacterium]